MTGDAPFDGAFQDVAIERPVEHEPERHRVRAGLGIVLVQIVEVLLWDRRAATRPIRAFDREHGVFDCNRKPATWQRIRPFGLLPFRYDPPLRSWSHDMNVQPISDRFENNGAVIDGAGARLASIDDAELIGHFERRGLVLLRGFDVAPEALTAFANRFTEAYAPDAPRRAIRFEQPVVRSVDLGQND